MEYTSTSARITPTFSKKKAVRPSARRYRPTCITPAERILQTTSGIAAPSSAPADIATRTARLDCLQVKTVKAARNGTRSRRTRVIESAPQPSQLGNIQVLEGVANAKDKQPHQEDAHQQVEEDADLDYQGHAEGSCQCGQKNPILEHEQPHDLHESFLATDHQKRADPTPGSTTKSASRIADVVLETTLERPSRVSA